MELLEVTQGSAGAGGGRSMEILQEAQKGRKENAWTFLSESDIFQFYVLDSARETFEEIQLFKLFNNVTSSHKIGSLPCRKVQPCANA